MKSESGTTRKWKHVHTLEEGCIHEFKNLVSDIAVVAVNEFEECAEEDAGNPWNNVATRVKQLTLENVGGLSDFDDVYVRHGEIERDPPSLSNQGAQLKLLAQGMGSRPRCWELLLAIWSASLGIAKRPMLPTLASMPEPNSNIHDSPASPQRGNSTGTPPISSSRHRYHPCRPRRAT